MPVRLSLVAAVYDRRWTRTAVIDRRYSMEAGCPHPARHWLRSLALLLTLTLTFPLSLAAADSEPAPLAAKSLLLDVARAGARLVAVGDRGHVLLSDDEGRTWRQVIVPTRAMLTGVSFGDAQHGWAAGHDGVILATADGGLTWTRQDSGTDLETIYLDVFFSDANAGLAAGAYGKCVFTVDGGKTWAPAAPIPDEAHINQITPAQAGTLYLAGEAGMLLTSSNAQTGWQKIGTPYDGSFFGVLPLSGRSLLAYGLRGHVFISNGEEWVERETPVPVLLMAGLKLKSGVIVLAGTGGNFFLSRDAGLAFGAWKPADYNGGVSALLETTDGALLVTGELGVARLQLPVK